MQKILITGGNKLKGKVAISGAKNSALPILTASILCAGGKSKIHNVPDLVDIACMSELLQNLGVVLNIRGEESLEQGSADRVIEIDAKKIQSDVAPYELVNKMRASILVLAPLLARQGHAKVALPGGCAIGMRPVDLHLKVLESMGAEISMDEGYINASLPGDRFKAAYFTFDKVSVGATETAIMAAVLADGESVLQNAAKEPEIIDLCNYLSACGAKIEGVGTSELKIEGVQKLQGVDHTVIADRIEAGTYAIAAAITGGDITLVGIQLEYMENVVEFLAGMGVEVTESDNNMLRFSVTKPLTACGISTAPYPLFPTDLQAPAVALNTLASGSAIIEEKIFENRFMHVPELVRMGATIKSIDNESVKINGVDHLSGAEVKATDLRASAALTLAALAADGKSVISDVEYLFRGYSNFIEKVRSLGGEISVTNGE